MSPDPAVKIAVVVLVMLLLLGLAVIGVRYAARQTRLRREAMRRKAEALRFQYEEKGDVQMLADLEKLVPGDHRRNPQIENLIRGERHGVPFEICDYEFVTGHGKHSHLNRQSVVRCRMDFPVPDFFLRPEHIFDKIGSYLGWHDIDFPHRPEFSSKNFLKGADEFAVRALFSDRVLSTLERQEDFKLLGGHGNWIAAWRVFRGKVEPEEFETYLDSCLEILAAFRAR
jgi:hypothetical protein